MNVFRPFLALVLTAVAVAAAEVRDLGEDLGYLRLSDVDGEAFSAPAGPLVIDFRRATQASPMGVERMRALLATPGLRLVLISRATSPALIELLRGRPATVLTLGGAEAPETDIRLSVSAEDDQKAYEALEQGISLADLANPPLVKARRDEAAIIEARRAANRAPEGPPRAAPGAPPVPPSPPSSAPAADATTPTSDPVLQRAVQLHRGLRALKRL